jgi:L,D-transpeptidase catalytic domain
VRWKTAVAVGAVLGGVLLAGCGGSGGDRSGDEATTESIAPEWSEAPVVVTDDRGRERPAPPAVRLDPRCERGRVLCADKSTRTLRWVVNGEVRMTFDARFGLGRYATREGRFEVYDMLRRHESSLYGTQMPFAMFFSGGQAVHYSRDFATKGYAGISHGCVNLRDRRGIAELFERVREGDKVVVYRSATVPS